MEESSTSAASISPSLQLESTLIRTQKSCGCKAGGGIIAPNDFKSFAAQQDMKESVEAAGSVLVEAGRCSELQCWISNAREHARARTRRDVFVLGRKEKCAALQKQHFLKNQVGMKFLKVLGGRKVGNGSAQHKQARLIR